MFHQQPMRLWNILKEVEMLRNQKTVQFILTFIIVKAKLIVVNPL